MLLISLAQTAALCLAFCTCASAREVTTKSRIRELELQEKQAAQQDVGMQLSKEASYTLHSRQRRANKKSPEQLSIGVQQRTAYYSCGRHKSASDVYWYKEKNGMKTNVASCLSDFALVCTKEDNRWGLYLRVKPVNKSVEAVYKCKRREGRRLYSNFQLTVVELMQHPMPSSTSTSHNKPNSLATTLQPSSVQSDDPLNNSLSNLGGNEKQPPLINHNITLNRNLIN